MAPRVVRFTTLILLFLSFVILVAVLTPDELNINRFYLVIATLICSLFGLGFYALFSVSYGVVTFNDCKEAKDTLICEVHEAKTFLKCL